MIQLKVFLKSHFGPWCSHHHHILYICTIQLNVSSAAWKLLWLKLNGQIMFIDTLFGGLKRGKSTQMTTNFNWIHVYARHDGYVFIVINGWFIFPDFSFNDFLKYYSTQNKEIVSFCVTKWNSFDINTHPSSLPTKKFKFKKHQDIF